MKNLITFLLFIGGLIFLTSCGKEVIDHRWKYMGDWEFTVHKSSFNVDSIGSSSQENFTYNGEIVIADCCDKIGIHYGSEDILIAKLDRDGNLYDLPSDHCRGVFDGTDRVHIYLRWGGLGGGISHVVDGVRK
ncbi:hypothetical protein G3O08_09550 [Cryomorpha ignava]|uniref:Lipoprotein n=1 Tax=Cryomorpha ignava TaxID=101383 RepID=A0A7K3WQH2_9FLAO|nr:hypothetical protein [Cryomorpha ignava]NEN23744.1 hypothetical protein [Cryomorpha ignava]